MQEPKRKCPCCRKSHVPKSLPQVLHLETPNKILTYKLPILRISSSEGKNRDANANTKIWKSLAVHCLTITLSPIGSAFVFLAVVAVYQLEVSTRPHGLEALVENLESKTDEFPTPSKLISDLRTELRDLEIRFHSVANMIGK